MSKHRHHEECCYPMAGAYGMGYSMGGYGGAGTACNTGNSGIRWIYALLILIVIVLQFGRRNRGEVFSKGEGDGCGCGSGFVTNKCDDQLIDNSVLFIIIVFLLVLCAGCGFGGSSCGTGYGGGAFGGGFGY